MTLGREGASYNRARRDGEVDREQGSGIPGHSLGGFPRLGTCKSHGHLGGSPKDPNTEWSEEEGEGERKEKKRELFTWGEYAVDPSKKYTLLADYAPARAFSAGVGLSCFPHPALWLTSVLLSMDLILVG